MKPVRRTVLVLVSLLIVAGVIGYLAIDGMIIKEIAGNEHESDPLLHGRVADLFQGLEACLANFLGDIRAEPRDAQAQVKVRRV